MRIDATHAASGSRSPQHSNDIMSRPAPAHVDTLRWNLADASERRQLLQAGGSSPSGPHQPLGSAQQNGQSDDSVAIGGIVWGSGQGIARQGNVLVQRGIEHTQLGETLHAQRAEIFKQYPAHYEQRWDFANSPVTNRGGASTNLRNYLDTHGITHNGRLPGQAPAGGVVDATQAARVGVPPNQINNHNGLMAEDALANRYRAAGYNVQRHVMVNTPLGPREVDVLATKNVGHPTLSEEIRIESKLGRNTLPSTANGSNVRMQVDKDAAALAQHRANAPAAQARGHQLHAQGTAALDEGAKLARAGKLAQTVGKIARPVGVVIGAFEIGSAYQADGNKVGVNTMSKAAGIAGGAGGAWAGAAAGAALGSVVPGVGTVIGGIAGGIVGGLIGEAAVSKAFDAVKSWFS
ncbi:hypothetical protein EII20_13775 [Comamonadaceae bacterium OH2545_COT-014]|nr:hypothetical protein EII20_13775 [Comamonadaceae bacterium OH2545_COT-014]